MTKPKMAGTKPIHCELEAGKTYAYCTCGESESQPFCDGHHAGTGFTPHVFKMAETKTAALCTCKMTADPPHCDGAHKSCAQSD